jgi:hypothetical protein
VQRAELVEHVELVANAPVLAQPPVAGAKEVSGLQLARDDLAEHVLARQARFAILPAHDARTHRPSLSLADLDRDRFLTPAYGTPVAYRRFLHLTDDRNREPPRVVDTQCRRAEEFLTAVSAGLGVATTIDSFRRFYPWPGVRYVPIDGTRAAAVTLVARAADRRAHVRDYITIARRAAQRPATAPSV